MENENNPYFLLGILANVLQIADFQMNVNQLSNECKSTFKSRYNATFIIAR